MSSKVAVTVLIQPNPAGHGHGTDGCYNKQSLECR